MYDFNFVCNEIYFRVFAVTLFVVFFVHCWFRAKKFNKLVEKDPYIRSLNKSNHLQYKTIVAPFYISCKKHRLKHLLYSVERIALFFFFVFLLVVFEYFQKLMGC